MIKIAEGTTDVVTAARQRILNVFETGLDVQFSVSGGKDSVCLAHLILTLIREKRIDPSKLTVQFIDEEAVFDEVERIVLKLRREFMLEGVVFNWYCIQVKHFNCFNNLSSDESFITWDEYAKDRWVRPMPKFAIKTHPLLKERIDRYQQFFERINQGKLSLIGLRTAESYMRIKTVATLLSNKKNDGGVAIETPLVYPIYDWADNDVWLYIKENKLDFPRTYLDLWQVGEGKNRMRLSQFFSSDTARILVKMGEHAPDLMERVIRREPNAYIASLYWDTELFRREKKNKVKHADGTVDEDIDYRKRFMDLFAKGDFGSPSQKKLAMYLRKQILVNGYMMDDNAYKMAYNIIVGDDPKHRAMRAFQINVRQAYVNKAFKETKAEETK